MDNDQQAFVCRIAPHRIDRVAEALDSNEIIIGWAEAEGLLDENLTWEEFREIIRQQYHKNDENLRRAGGSAGQMWRFIREMKIGDLVVVPHGPEFYVARVSGPASYNPKMVAEDTAYRRKVEWLNAKQPIPRRLARSALLSRMKIMGTCAYATDLLGQIQECLQLAGLGKTPTFQTDLQQRLVRETLDELRSGRLDSYGFEKLICGALTQLGAVEARIIPRSEDKGADVVATFKVAGAFQQVVAVQAKHYQPEPPVEPDVIKQLIQGIQAESANLGMVITSGSFTVDAEQAAEDFTESSGIRIELVDGTQFATLLVENGILAT